MKRLSLFVGIICVLLSVQSVYAVTVSVSNVPSTLTQDQEADVNVSISGASANTTNYVRAALYPDGSTSSYSGFTFNGSSWYNGTPSPIDPHQFLQVQIDSQGSWSGQLRAKIDTSDPSFQGSGTYFLKIGRYTASGSSVSDWSDPQQITVIAPSPTPTPAPTSSSSSSSSQSNTKTPTPTINTGNPSVSVTLSPDEMEGASDGAEILGTATDSGEQFFDETSPAPTALPTAEVLGDSTNNTPFIFFMLGILVVGGACGILFYRNWKKKKSASSI